MTILKGQIIYLVHKNIIVTNIPSVQPIYTHDLHTLVEIAVLQHLDAFCDYADQSTHQLPLG